MCLAIPARVVTIDADCDMATVALGDVEKQVSLALVEDVQIDDYVLVHVGYALNKISQAEAEKTLAIFAEAGMVDNANIVPSGEPE
jgi:hydrogenase expression/formation protein HypC